MIPRSECYTSADNRVGLCMPKAACSSTGGIVAGNCGLLMACCIYQGTCRSVISANESYFVSPQYPTLQTERLNPPMCIFTLHRNNLIQKYPICQIRLDFDEFSLAPPRNGSCGYLTDSFVISGASNFNSTGLPANGLCGDLTGQHVYIDVDPAEINEPLLLVVNTANEEMYNRKWSIRIQQIPCQSPFRAPSGCLQYYTSTSGTVESLNYRGMPRSRPYNQQQGSVSSSITSLLLPTQSPNYFHNMNYGICIAQAPRSCGIRWTSADFDFGGFRKSQSGVGYQNPNIVSSGCTVNRGQSDGGDYVVIPSGSADGLTMTQDRFCGQRLASVDGSSLSTPITSYSKPFVLYVHSDDTDDLVFTGPTNQKGFALKYEQITCS
ncbi:uncharacterized protein LOC128392036 isoform X2 [Panonychus citri]|nr:uncharacterized protein LOC128392036 isoform X2 [Panonychus citri]